MMRWKTWTYLSIAILLSVRAQASGGVALNGGSVMVTGPAEFNTTGDIQLASGTLQAVGAAQFSVGGNWTQNGSGSFVCDQSTVFFLGDSTLSGTSRFYNFTAPTIGQTLTLTAGSTQTIDHAFAMSGASGTPSHLRSSSVGAFAYLTNLGSNAVNDVDVRDCNAFGGEVIDAGPHSTLVNTVNWSYGGALLAPQLVTHVLASQPGSAPSDPLTYSWIAVNTYTDGSSIPNGIDPTYEITRYTDPIDTLSGTLSASGLVQSAYGPASPSASGVTYYGIRAVVNKVKSDPFYVDNNPQPNYLYASSNGNGYVLVPPPLQDPFAGLAMPYFYLTVVTRVDQSGQSVLASASLQIQSRGGTAPADYHFAPPGATLVLKRTGPIPPAQVTYPVELNVDGTWKTVGTAAYSAAKDAFTFTAYQTGTYRVDGTVSSGATALPILQAVHPRVFSPNGDGYNDIVYFDLLNPGQDSVHGDIFDVQAAKVAELQVSPLGLQWDGRGSGGRIVPGGIYIYQIYVGSKRVNGTVVVVK